MYKKKEREREGKNGNERARETDRQTYLPVIREKERGSLGGILEITLFAREQELRGVSLIRWYTASGICISWQSDKSEQYS